MELGSLMDGKRISLLFAGSALLVAAVGSAAADGEGSLDEIIRATMAERGASPQIAPDYQLCRRYAIDLTGVIPSPADLAACEGRSPAEMFDHFRSKGPLPHTGGEPAYLWVNLLRDADHFLFSNGAQFSQVAHIREFRDQLRRVYAEGMSYREFARWALESQMFLNRFPSGADRANASFFLFLGRDSLASEVPVGNMWNGWVLREPDLPASAAEEDPDYHEYDWDPSACSGGRTLCSAEFWGRTGSTPAEAIDAMLSSHLFVEATVDRYWERLLGYPLPGVDYPDIRRTLVLGFVESGYDVNWLIREIATSPAYTQQMMFR